MEAAALLMFCAVLIVCVVLNINILFALLCGLVIFVCYAGFRRFGVRSIARMIASGIFGARNVLIVFMLIGILTALWRECGTIPAIIVYASSLISPSTVVLMSFVLCSAVSMLTGTSFGTAATMGVVCMTMARAMGIDAAVAGGAVLAGCFFGDRCSPVSTSALLVCELTETDIYSNIKSMLKTAAVPFIVSAAIYAIIGIFSDSSGKIPQLSGIFGKEFIINFAVLIPALIIVIMSLMRINVKLTMIVSIAAAFVISVFVQKNDVVSVLRTAIAGYSAQDAEVAQLLSGGGVVSMLRVAAIVCISSAYAGIFRETGMLDTAVEKIRLLSEKVTPYGATLVTSLLAGVIACNQTLTIMLTHQLCSRLCENRQERAMNLEDTAVVTSALIPWSIACAVPLSSVSAPTASVVFACFLYILPISRLIRAYVLRTRKVG